MTTKINCLKCGNEFEPQCINLLGIDRVLSEYCYECREKIKAENEASARAGAEREAMDRKARWLKSSGVPLKYQTVSFETFENRGYNSTKIKKLCQDYAINFPMVSGGGYKSLVITSPSNWGVGKTHLVCSIARTIIDRWARLSQSSPVLYLTEPDMFRRIRSTFSREYDKETEQDVYDALLNVPLLIIDDVGKEEVSDLRFVQRAWFSVINGRYDNMLPIVLTANLTPDGIAYHLGGSRGNEAAWDRLLEMAENNFWELNGTSKRRENYGMPDKTG